MAINFDQIVNFAIPVGIVILFIAIFYHAFKPHLDTLFGAIKDMFASKKDKIVDATQEIVYQ